MSIFIDSSKLSEIKKYHKLGIIRGVTTNPTLIRRSGRNPDDVYADLIDDVGVQDLSIEVNGRDTNTLLENGIKYGKYWTHQATIKLPCTYEGIKACKTLSFMGLRVNMTLVFSVEQAILCSLAGATYVSPFIGRLDDNGGNGINLVRDIANVFCHNRSETKILAASIREPEIVSMAFEAGADICTVPVAVFDDMFKHFLTDAGLQQFLVDSGQI